MSEFTTVRGFEDVWRPPVRPRRRTPEAVLPSGHRGDETRARLIRVVNRAPEVMVKVTGRTRDKGHLRAHLNYISRHGALTLAGRDGEPAAGRGAVREVAEDWALRAECDSRRCARTPVSLSVVLSMPRGADPQTVWDAAQAWAASVFGDRFDYLMALHTDAAHPHVHVAVCARGTLGERLNPKKADLDHWRQVFAQALRDRSVEAEATPRRARGVSRKAERMPLRKMGERLAAGRGDMANTLRGAYHDAGRVAVQRGGSPTVWEDRLLDRQRRVRRLYLAQARLLQTSLDAEDRKLGLKVEAFVRGLPPPDTRRLALARELRAAGRGPPKEPDTEGRMRRR